MKRRTVPIAAALILLLAPAAPAEESAASRGLLNSLRANRSLLNRYHAEYIQLKKEAAEPLPEGHARKLQELEDKIRVLEEDAEELQSFLPMGGQAEALIWDLMSEKARVEKEKERDAAESFLNEAALKHRLAATSDDAQSTYQMHERALKLVTEGRFRDAVQLYEEIVLRNPDDDEAYLIMGHTYLLMGLPQRAERAFDNAVHIDPANIDQIMPFYENMILQDPDNDSAYANLGYAALMVGNFFKARDAFVEALKINPDNLAAQNGLMALERAASQASRNP